MCVCTVEDLIFLIISSEFTALQSHKQNSLLKAAIFDIFTQTVKQTTCERSHVW